MEVLLGKSPLNLANGPFSIAMFDYQRVAIKLVHGIDWLHTTHSSHQPGTYGVHLKTTSENI